MRPTAGQSPTGATINISSDDNVRKRQGKAVGPIGVLFLTVTGAAPDSAMLGHLPCVAGCGTGLHTPAAFLLATVVLTPFCVAYTKMATKVSSVGGFYAVISQGVGSACRQALPRLSAVRSLKPHWTGCLHFSATNG